MVAGDIRFIDSSQLPSTWKTAPRGWGHPLHKLLQYIGQYPPSLARFFVRQYSRPGQLVFDPFSGAAARLLWKPRFPAGKPARTTPSATPIRSPAPRSSLRWPGTLMKMQQTLSQRTVLAAAVLALAIHSSSLAAQESKPGFEVPEGIAFRAAEIMSEGTRLAAEVFAPKEPKGGKLPTILMCHGWGGLAEHLRGYHLHPGGPGAAGGVLRQGAGQRSDQEDED